MQKFSLPGLSDPGLAVCANSGGDNLELILILSIATAALLMICLMIVLVYIILLKPRRKLARLQRAGVPAQATLVAITKKTGYNNAAHRQTSYYDAVYRFDHGEQTYEYTEVPPKTDREWLQTQVGQRIEIVFDPLDPSFFRRRKALQEGTAR